LSDFPNLESIPGKEHAVQNRSTLAALAREVGRLSGLSILVFAFTIPSTVPSAIAAQDDDACTQVGNWIVPGSSSASDAGTVLGTLAAADMVLLGEAHTTVEHHRWQLHSLAALHTLRPNMVIAFEMFPRRVQPILDQWVAGTLQPDAFLETVEWARVWGYDADLYLPLFHFARQHRIPMVAMNVERRLISRVAETGWEAIPEQEREGVTAPATAGRDYRASLAQLYRNKQRFGLDPKAHVAADDVETPEAALAALAEDVSFQRFVQAQTTWDRAMAEAMVSARQDHPGAWVVAVVGRGHVEFDNGIEHQLEDLGVQHVASALPIEVGEACRTLTPGVADYVFTVADWQAQPEPRPLLGVMVQDGEGGAEVQSVSDTSVAADAGIQAGDVIVEAAGFPTPGAADLIEVIRRQAPGTWLPLKVRRHDRTREFVARFPTRFDAP
jgi:uncharacterized iron-regulated protein